MAFDYKKAYPEFYLPKSVPGIVDIPAMNFLAVRGEGNPNEKDGEYQAAIGLLYGIAFTIKMSKKGGRQPEGYFDFVVPPLEGFWWQPGGVGIDYTRKEAFQWISLIRLPDFVTEADFRWAVEEAARKKKADFSKVKFFPFTEGLCVQCMHLGPYDDEPATIARMTSYAESRGFETDLTASRCHHEIYLSDARRCEPAKMKTVIRHPIRKSGAGVPALQ